VHSRGSMRVQHQLRTHHSHRNAFQRVRGRGLNHQPRLAWQRYRHVGDVGCRRVTVQATQPVACSSRLCNHACVHEAALGWRVCEELPSSSGSYNTTPVRVNTSMEKKCGVVTGTMQPTTVCRQSCLSITPAQERRVEHQLAAGTVQ
jgi:hypothetical protein